MLVAAAAAAGAEKDPAVPIIFDTDMDTDCDDAGALAMLHALADVGEARILATVVSSKYPYSAPCVAAINRYFGRPDIPIGVPEGEGASTSRGSRYAKAIAEEFPTGWKTGDGAPSAAMLYRRILAGEPDHSVVVVTVGYLTNLRDLLETKADETSPLSGPDLVRRKVKRWTCMGGGYPEDLQPAGSGNFKPDPRSAVAVARDWPGPVSFSGDGRRILTGGRLRTQAPPDHPVRRVYDLYLGERPTRPSWDQVALLHAVRPDARYWRVTAEGHNHIFPNGTNQWRAEPDDPRHRLVAIAPGCEDQVREIIDSLMAHGPAPSGNTLSAPSIP
ncbi:MAG: nucleoside hydrolase, partial [Planctomycetes bacterium]|nr:nucleoside hydrolase [Planctomycetota bacterium]